MMDCFRNQLRQGRAYPFEYPLWFEREYLSLRFGLEDSHLVQDHLFLDAR